MIVVIADDLSGATELAALAHAHGLSAEVQTVFDPTSSARVVAVDSDSRTCSRKESAARVRSVAKCVLKSNPEWLYKKTDSVLRGHIRSEITELLALTGKTRALFIPANPGRNRIIRDGRYFVDGKPLDQTVFATDPDYPAKTSVVSELLNREPGSDAITVPNIDSAETLAKHAATLDSTTLPAGAAEFFAALLPQRAMDVHWLPPSHQPSLYVCGSAASWPTRREQCRERAIPFFAGPPNQILDVATAVRDRGGALIGIGDSQQTSSSRELETKLAESTRSILETTRIERLFLEGGATAAAVLRQLNATRLTVSGQYAKGIAACQIAGRDFPLIAIKPGSYPWPANVWI
jgi:uncharacterized protein YgbK (DUF1537 family)